MKGMYDIDLESRVDIVKCLVWNFVSITFLSQRVTKVLKTEQVFLCLIACLILFPLETQ